MKESGVEWIGQIPEEWGVSKLEQYVDIFGRIGFRGYTTNDIVNEGEGAISYSPSNIIDYSVIDNNNTYISWSKYDESPEIQIKTGDVLYVKTGSSYGKAGIVNNLSNKATINPQLVVLKPKKNIDSRLINYFLNSSVGKDQSELIVGGSTIPTITQESIKKMIFPKMSFEEQQKIADFLDKKTAQLDKVKSLLEEQIQKLRGYRANLIYETVTKGLDKTVPMKDSEIDWIGQVPEGWGVTKFKYLGDVKQGLTYSPSDVVDKNEGILVLRSGNIQNGSLDFNNNVYVKTKVVESIVLRKNDILITARNGSPALIGKNAIIDTDIKATFGAFMMVFRANKSLFAKFAYYLMNVSFSFYRTFFTTSTVNQLTAAIFNGIEVPLPSVSEQQRIADFLDKKTVQIDKLIQIKNQQVKNIDKQRQTLIYDYVTGKRRV